MTDRSSVEAWNNFVLNAKFDEYEKGDPRRSAAIARMYVNLVNNGGINFFLTCRYELDAADVIKELVAVGARRAADELENVLRLLDAPLRPLSEKDRWDLLEQHWTDSLDKLDNLSDAANAELMRVLDLHVHEYEEFYLSLK